MHATGGETPLRALDDAAARVASGEARVVLLAGAEGTRAAIRARKAGSDLPWTPPGRRPAMPSFGPDLQRAAAVGISRALHCFPLYEHGYTPMRVRHSTDAQRESVAMWADLARIAATSPTRRGRLPVPTPRTSRVLGPDNRMISFPYPKSLTANPFVNQGAALFVTDAESARGLGIPESRWVYPLGGAAPTSLPTRARAWPTTACPRSTASIRDVQAVTNTTPDDYDVVELYSCFPAMPKLTRRGLECPAAAPISVIGGLSFFGGPGSNYLTHSLAAVVERLRPAEGGTAFVHGVGMFNTKHHALVLADHPRRDPVSRARIPAGRAPRRSSLRCR